MPWVLLGCGYTATRLARRLLADGARVIATRRTSGGAAATTAALAAAAAAVKGRLEIRVADLLAPDTLGGLIPPGAVIVHSAPPSLGDQAPAAERALVATASAAGAARMVYVSSSGVYGPGEGAWIDEDVPTRPTGALGRRRLAAESAVREAARDAGLSCIVLRAAAIYGPGRGAHVRIAAGTYPVIGEGNVFVSRVHVDDLGEAILAAALAPSPPRAIYNVADEEPTTSRAFADGVAALLGVAPPRSIPPGEASADARDLLGGDRRVSSRRLREELGVALRYPSWREGVAQALAEERQAAPLA